MTDTITVNGYELPDTPQETTSVAFYSMPRTHQRWVHYVGSGHDVHLIWVGMCQCDYCGNSLWESPEGMPQNSPNGGPDIVSHVWGSSFQPASRQVMIEQGMIPEDWAEDWLPAISMDCVRNSTRRRTAFSRAQAEEGRRLVRWPESFFADQIAAAEKRLEEERIKVAHLLVPHPVVPVHGAFMWDEAKQSFPRFDSWTEDGKVKTIDGAEYEPDKIMALTSVVYGVPHENAIFVPSSGMGPNWLCSITRYNGYNATVKVTETGRSTTVGVNGLALMVPPLNPATEKPEEKSARLERELDRVKETLHRRMVAEGEARSWCSEFDPILDSNGLKPRRPQIMVRGVIHFAYDANDPIAAGTITKMRNGTHQVTNTIPAQHLRLIEIEQTEPVFTPRLS